MQHKYGSLKLGIFLQLCIFQHGYKLQSQRWSPSLTLIKPEFLTHIHYSVRVFVNPSIMDFI